MLFAQGAKRLRTRIGHGVGKEGLHGPGRLKADQNSTRLAQIDESMGHAARSEGEITRLQVVVQRADPDAERASSTIKNSS